MTATLAPFGPPAWWLDPELPFDPRPDPFPDRQALFEQLEDLAADIALAQVRIEDGRTADALTDLRAAINRCWIIAGAL